MQKQSKRKTPIVKTLPYHGHSASEFFRELSEDGKPGFIWESSASKSHKKFFSIHTPGRYSYIGFDVAKHLLLREGRIRSYSDGNLVGDDPVPTNGVFEAVMSKALSSFENCDFESELELPPFLGGIVGLVSYDAVRYVEKIKGLQIHEYEPEFFLLSVDRFLVIDHEQQKLVLVCWPRANSLDSKIAANEIASRIEKMPRPSAKDYQRSTEVARYDTIHSESVFCELVARAKEYIAAGDIFQVVLGHTALVEKRPDPVSLYDYLRQHNQSPYHYCLRFGDSTLVGASPEVMLQGVSIGQNGHNKRKVFMRPVAGTYPRASSPTEDERLACQLRNDPKEQAEHVMLVDLERNDIGRVSEIGSVKVQDLLSVESYGKVHHLVSEVSGVLRPDASIMDALESCFPIGTLAGAPKIRAMEIIAELERSPRGAFGGAIVMQGINGIVDSCVAIRHALCAKDKTIVRAGAGIVQDSEPEREHRECLWKAEAVLQGIEAVEERSG